MEQKLDNPKRSVVTRFGWLWIFLTGMILYFGTYGVTSYTGNTVFFPTLIFLGSFLVPVTFIVYFYQHIRDRDIPQPTLAASFLIGGATGIITAGFIEFETLSHAGAFTYFGVGFIEESAKLIFPIILYVWWRYRHEADGLLFGVSVGMGFAAMETMGYGLMTLINNQYDLAALNDILVLRGLISPAGHASWTGIVTAVLWRERQRTGRITINFKVVGAFVLAAMLHSFWNIFNTSSSIPVVYSYGGAIIIVFISLGTLLYLFQQARTKPFAKRGNSPEVERVEETGETGG